MELEEEVKARTDLEDLKKSLEIESDDLKNKIKELEELKKSLDEETKAREERKKQLEEEQVNYYFTI